MSPPFPAYCQVGGEAQSFAMMTMPAQSNVMEIERAYLGALMRDGLRPLLPLVPSDFYDPRNSEVYAAVLALDQKGTPCDELVVSQKLREERSSVAEHYVSGLVTDVGFTIFNPAWPKLIRDQAERRRLEKVTKQAAKAAEEGSISVQHIKEALERNLRPLGAPAAGLLGVEIMPLDKLRAFDRNQDPQCRIGRRWLCRESTLLIVGQSGVGKSSLMIQMAISWAIGRDFFGIRSKAPRRVLVMQGENDMGDIAEGFQDVCKGFGDWTPRDQETLEANLKVMRVNEKTGAAFATILREAAIEHSADFVFVDPLLSYASGNVSSTEDMSRFLREQIAPVLKATGIILVAMHHTGKPGNADDKQGRTVTDNSYEGIGSSEITNFFRAIMVLSRAHREEPLFKLLISKRRSRAGLLDQQSRMVDQVYLSHSKNLGEVRWEYATPEQLIRLTEKKPKKKGF